MLTSKVHVTNRYAKELVDIMYADDAPNFGAASDGKYDIVGRFEIIHIILTLW